MVSKGLPANSNKMGVSLELREGLSLQEVPMEWKIIKAVTQAHLLEKILTIILPKIKAVSQCIWLPGDLWHGRNRLILVTKFVPDVTTTLANIRVFWGQRWEMYLTSCWPWARVKAKTQKGNREPVLAAYAEAQRRWSHQRVTLRSRWLSSGGTKEGTDKSWWAEEGKK